MMPHADPTHKISIVARGAMGGYTRFLPDEERHLHSKKQFEAMLAVAMGGRMAEEVSFGEVTTGASNDFEQATRIARNMVTRFGMSDKLGPRTFGRREELVFLGREISEQRDYSDRIAEEIDNEVHILLDTAHNAARQILTENRAKLDQMAHFLVQFESIEGEELERLFTVDPSASAEEVAETVRIPAPTPPAPGTPNRGAGDRPFAAAHGTGPEGGPRPGARARLLSLRPDEGKTWRLKNVCRVWKPSSARSFAIWPPRRTWPISSPTCCAGLWVSQLLGIAAVAAIVRLVS